VGRDHRHAADPAGQKAATRKAAAIAVSDLDVPVLRSRNQPVLMFGIMLSAMLPLIDTTIANVAIPYMQSALGATPESVMWALTSYIIAHAVAMPIASWLADRIGSRELMILSVALFIVTSMLCGIATSLEEMVLFRTLQGMFGAFIVPLGQTAILDTSRPSRHTQVMAFWAFSMSIGPIMGPLAGGWLTENWNWRWVFYVNLPFGLLALVALIIGLPGHPRRKRRFDLLGFVLVGAFLASLQLLLDRGSHVDWFNSVECWIYLLICLSTLWMAVIHIATTPDPLFDTALFRDQNYMVAFFFMILIGVVIYSTAALFPPMLQGLLGYSAYDTGLMLAPRGLGAMLGLFVGQALLRRYPDPRITVGLGFVCVAISLYRTIHWSLSVSEFEILWTGLIQGVGVSFISMPVFMIAFTTLAPRLRTDGGGLLTLSRMVGSSLSISIAMAIYAHNVQVNHSELAGALDTSMIEMAQEPLSRSIPEVSQTLLSLADHEINRQAAMIAFLNDIRLVLWLTLAFAPVILFIRRHPPNPAPA
jgi:DHA2 family multidrug resistance protein